MKTFLLAAMLAAVLSVPVQAETFKIPASNPYVTVEIPDGWTATQIERGIEVSSDDDEVYLAIEGTPMKDLTEVATDAVKFLNRAGVTVDKSTEKKTDGKINGMDMYDIGWAGKDKDGDVVVHLTIVTIEPTKGVLFTYWASPKGDKEHDADIVKMVRSIKKVRN